MSRNTFIRTTSRWSQGSASHDSCPISMSLFDFNGALKSFFTAHSVPPGQTSRYEGIKTRILSDAYLPSCIQRRHLKTLNWSLSGFDKHLALPLIFYLAISETKIYSEDIEFSILAYIFGPRIPETHLYIFTFTFSAQFGLQPTRILSMGNLSKS